MAGLDAAPGFGHGGDVRADFIAAFAAGDLTWNEPSTTEPSPSGSVGSGSVPAHSSSRTRTPPPDLGHSFSAVKEALHTVQPVTVSCSGYSMANAASRKPTSVFRSTATM